MQTFVTLHYREIEGELTRPAFSPNYKALHVPLWRCLRLYVWRLEQSAKQWSHQLTAYYRQQPVFAMQGGQVDGAWLPIDRSCERMKLPLQLNTYLALDAPCHALTHLLDRYSR